MIVEIGNVLVTTDIFTEQFCCDLATCKGQCCVEGVSGAPVKTEEIAELEEAMEEIYDELPTSAQAIIDQQGVIYNDRDGELVTSIIGTRNCVFSHYRDLQTNEGEIDNCCCCLLETAFREGRTMFQKPISCALYPLREKRLANGMIGLNYDKWDICAPARRKGSLLGLPLYKFLHDPLVRRFGKEWIEEVEEVAQQLSLNNIK